MSSQNTPTVPASTRWTKSNVAGIVLAIVTLASSVFFLIGCMAPTLRALAIYRVEVAELAHELTKPAALSPSNNTFTKTDLLHPALPPYWFYGLSGICDFYTDSARISAKGETVCRQEFPPNQHVLHVVEASLRSGFARGLNGTLAVEDQETVVRGVLSSWEAALKSNTRLLDNEARVSVQGKASAALVIVAILLDIPSWGIAFVFGVHPWGKRLADLLGLSSMVLAGAAAACAVLAMNGGMHGVVSGVGNVSGSLVFLVIGALLRIPVVELLLPRRLEGDRQEVLLSPLKLDRNRIGALGEAFMFNWFQHFIPDFSMQHWSSHVYVTQQGRFADFTYTDHQGYMGAALQGAGVLMMPYWGRGTKYHIEVKSTPGECKSAPMFFSPNQINMMQRLNDGPDAYIVARVYRVGTVQPAVRFFPRPWQWFGAPYPPIVRCDLQFDYNQDRDDDTRVWIHA